VELVSVNGSRQLPLSEFILGNRKTARRPDEILSCVLVPRELENAASTFLKLGARRYLVISIAMVAVVLESQGGTISQARIAVGSCAARAQRLTQLERDLVGLSVNGDLSSIVKDHHVAVLSPISDVRATAEYRHDAASTLVARALETCARSC
jgi:CO/xanthine dehydrogenase FAD-binding subunit